MTTVEVPEFKMDPSAAKMVQSLLAAATEIAATDTDDLAKDTKRLQETVSQLQSELAGIRKHVSWVQYQPTNDSSDRLPDLLSKIDLDTVIDENGVIAAAEQAKRMAVYLTGIYAKNLDRGDILQPLAKAALYLSAHLMRVDNYLRAVNPNSRARQYEPGGSLPPPPPVAPPSPGGAQPPGPPVAPPTKPEDNDEMEARVTNLEKDMKDALGRLGKIEGKLDHVATKSDLSDAMHSQTKWMATTAAGLVAAALAIMTFVLNNAIPKPATPQPTQPPIVINVPAGTVAPAPPAVPASR
ncbi:hypothetical protein [Paracidovorax avenae]|uniref:hypothetical protein n=1 Tax=Paracidovorax avenae TaxID=80867 RepID=UPI000B10089A|nr:hypothetical protein [Paracidovorax avenae]